MSKICKLAILMNVVVASDGVKDVLSLGDIENGELT